MSAVSKTKLRVGFAGLGRIFSLHLAGYADSPDAEIVALFDPDFERCTAEAAKLPGAVACRDYAALLAQNLDLVEILSPHPHHADQTVAAFARGAHVSVQKPMAMSLAEADRMIAAADAAGCTLRVFENFRFLPALAKAKELLDAGAIGAPRHCRLRTLAGDPARAWAVAGDTWKWRAQVFENHQLGRLSFDDGHHKMAAALWFFGPVRDVFAFIDTKTTPFGAIDSPASIAWRHRGGVHVIWDIVHAPEMLVRTDYYSLDESFQITGEKGVIEVTRATGRMLDEPVLTLYRDGEVRAFHNIETDWGKSFAAATRALVSGLREGRRDVPLTGGQGRDVLELGLAVAQSAATGRAVSLPLAEPPTKS